MEFRADNYPSNHAAASMSSDHLAVEHAVLVEGVSHRYGERIALSQFSISIRPGEVFAMLGPNGSGKTTCFRLLSTLIPPQDGRLSIYQQDVALATAAVRRLIGVVFQSPSVDGKLTVRENLAHQAALYGLPAKATGARIVELLEEFRLQDRGNDLVDTLSGGLRRRVELAKGLLHQPQVLLLDEPSTGLDPGARSDLWLRLLGLRDQLGMTIVFTTHLLEEAEKADRIAILDEGRLVALDTPDALRASVGGETITIETSDAIALAQSINAFFDDSGSPAEARVVGGQVRLEKPDGRRWVADLLKAFPDQIDSIKLGKPTLEDVFIARTGRQFWTTAAVDESTSAAKKKRK